MKYTINIFQGHQLWGEGGFLQNVIKLGNIKEEI